MSDEVSKNTIVECPVRMTYRPLRKEPVRPGVECLGIDLDARHGVSSGRSSYLGLNRVFRKIRLAIKSERTCVRVLANAGSECGLAECLTLASVGG